MIFEMGGRQETQAWEVVPNLVTNVAEAKKGEMNAADQQKRLRAAIERTIVPAEADAFIATSTHQKCVLVRRALKDCECGDEEGWQAVSLCVPFSL